MPMGAEAPLVGYASFFAIKLAGYSLFGRLLSRAYGKPRNAWWVGAVRTVIGMVAGAMYYGLILLISPHLKGGEVLFLVGIVPLRVIEWWVLIWCFYDRDLRRRRNWAYVVLGTLWSFVLDVPAIAGLFVTGGFWIC